MLRGKGRLRGGRCGLPGERGGAAAALHHRERLGRRKSVADGRAGGDGIRWATVLVRGAATPCAVQRRRGDVRASALIVVRVRACAPVRGIRGMRRRLAHRLAVPRMPNSPPHSRDSLVEFLQLNLSRTVCVEPRDDGGRLGLTQMAETNRGRGEEEPKLLCRERSVALALGAVQVRAVDGRGAEELAQRPVLARAKLHQPLKDEIEQSVALRPRVRHLVHPRVRPLERSSRRSARRPSPLGRLRGLPGRTPRSHRMRPQRVLWRLVVGLAVVWPRRCGGWRCRSRPLRRARSPIGGCPAVRPAVHCRCFARVRARVQWARHCIKLHRRVLLLLLPLLPRLFPSPPPAEEAAQQHAAQKEEDDHNNDNDAQPR